jgi:hypothetical protein
MKRTSNLRASLVLAVFIACISCDQVNQETLENANCDGLVDGVYEFPALPANHRMSQDGVTAFWQIPAGVLECISTEGLVLTNLNYPGASLILASSSTIQNGYIAAVRTRFNGAAELETRPDRGSALVEVYKKVDPLAYGANWTEVQKGDLAFEIMYLEVIIGQYAHLEAMTPAEKHVLATALLTNLDRKKESDVHGGLGQMTTTAVMMRMMKNDKFPPFMQVYDSENPVWQGLEGFSFASAETIELVKQLSKDYLGTLKP